MLDRLSFSATVDKSRYHSFT